MSVLLIEGDQTLELPLPYLSVTKHLLTPSSNHCSHLQCSHCFSQNRNNCSSRSTLNCFQSSHSNFPRWPLQPHQLSVCHGNFLLLWNFFSWFTFLRSLYADCSCVPARSFVSRFLLSFTPDTFLPISMQHREYTQYKYTTLTLYYTSNRAMPDEPV